MRMIVEMTQDFGCMTRDSEDDCGDDARLWARGEIVRMIVGMTQDVWALGEIVRMTPDCWNDAGILGWTCVHYFALSDFRICGKISRFDISAFVKLLCFAFLLAASVTVYATLTYRPDLELGSKSRNSKQEAPIRHDTQEKLQHQQTGRRQEPA